MDEMKIAEFVPMDREMRLRMETRIMAMMAVIWVKSAMNRSQGLDSTL